MAKGMKTGGRVKGTPNKKTQAVLDKLEAADHDPILAMVKIAKKAYAMDDLHLAGAMNRELAQYVAPKRKAVEVTGEIDIDTVQDIALTVIDGTSRS